MSLKDISIKPVYRSGEDDLMKDFYIPCLSVSNGYDRAVGFFSTSILVYALSGISQLLRNNGEMRLVIGYPLSDEEFEVLKSGEPLKHLGHRLESSLEEMINEATTDLLRYRLKIFFLMTVTGKLRIKFAYRKRGMYHEKIGVFRDGLGNKVLFQGSANETTNATNPDLNYESISVYKSWISENYNDYAQPYENGFEKIWCGADPHVHTADIPSELYTKIHKKIQKGIEFIPVDDVLENEVKLIEYGNESYNNGYPVVPINMGDKKFKVFPHQDEALKSWSENRYTGIFKLATGAGKTVTAMYAVAKLFERNRNMPLAYIVAVPYVALADQWVQELAKFNMKPIRCYGNKTIWQERLNSAISQLNIGKIEFFSVVVVNQSLRGEAFQSSLKRLDSKKIFFVGDECHHHSTNTFLEAIPEAQFKIGLSATPYSEEIDAGYETDPVKIENLKNIYGSIVAEYGMAKALGDGVLTPYNYYIRPVALNEIEMLNFIELSKEMAKLFSQEKGELSSRLKDLIRRRNKIISNASQKMLALIDVLKDEKFAEKRHSLVYVGEGNVLDNEEGAKGEVAQLTAVSTAMMSLGWKVSRFTAQEKKADRLAIMEDFTEGNIDALVSMRVLDEGIDIPACKRAFILASTTNSRQFIQRRGRILRKSEGKDIADIYDFVVIPNSSMKNESCFVSLVRRELYRVMEFVKLSQNRVAGELVASELADMFELDIKEF